MATDNKKRLYDALSQDYDMGSYEQFCNDLNDEAKRRKLYDATSQDYDLGSWDSFSQQLGYGQPAAHQATQYFKVRRGGRDFSVSADEVNAAGGLQGWAAAHPGAPLRVYMQGKNEDGTDFDGHVDLSVAHERSKGRGYKYTTTSKAIEGKTWQPTEQQKIAMSRRLADAQRQTDTMLADSKEQRENLREYYRGSGGLGSGPTEGAPAINPETGKPERTYITPTGERMTDKIAAEEATRSFREAVAAADMSVGAQIRRTQTELDELRGQLAASAGRVHDEWKDEHNKNGAPLASVLAANTYMPRQMSDKENAALRVAIHQKEEALKDLLEERDRRVGKDVGFWRGFGRTVSDSRTWDFGVGDMLDEVTMLNADKYSGPNATEGEKKAGEAMMKAIHDRQQVEQLYGDNASFWNRAGVMTGYMPSFMLDFAMTGGGYKALNVVGKAATRGAVKLIGKEAVKEMTDLGIKAYAKKYGVRGIGRMAENWTIKALGTTADDLLIRAPLMTNTVQAGKTAADVINRKLGDVTIDENGNYDFSNNKTWGSAIWQGEANNIIENYSEMFGTHLDGVVPGLAKTFGGKRISGMLARANASSYGQILATTRKQFERLGVSDYFGEVSEEYYGQLWRTRLNLDDAYTKVPVYDDQGNQVLDADGNPVYERKNLLFTVQFHGDIWGGMALSMGLMGAGKYAVSGIAYGHMKHQVSKADHVAAEVFTPERWEPIREIIDNTTNEDMGALAESMVNDNTLSDEERNAAMTYMERSLNFRGHNLGAIAQSRGASEEEYDGGVTINSELSQSYLNGYEASAPREMNDAQNMYEYQRQRLMDELSDLGEEDVAGIIADIERNPVEALRKTYDDWLREIVRDYANAKMVRDGIVHRVNDDIDAQIARSGAMIKARVNKTSGMIQPAVMGLDDRQVYIVDGTLATNEDGTIDRDASDETIIFRDAQTGEIDFADPRAFVSVGEAIGPETEMAVAVENIRQQAAQAAVDAMNGTLAFNPGDEVQIDHGGELTDVTIVGPAVDENGMPIQEQVIVRLADGTQSVYTKEELQAWADAANIERLNNFEAARGALTLAPNNAESVPNPSDAAVTDSQESALSRLPVDEQGQPMYDEIEPDTAWDAIVEQAQGDEATAAEVVADIVADRQDDFNAAEKALTKTKEGKPEKRKKGDPAPTMEERIAAKNAAKEALAEAHAIRDRAKAALDHWQRIADTRQRRERERRNAEEAEARRVAAERAEAEKTERAAREEAARQEREALEGIPEWHMDTPENARKRGVRRFSGQMFTRQEPLQAVAGKEVDVKFSQKDLPKGRLAVIEAEQLQPSHIQGQRNPMFFIDEAQPKNRAEAVSMHAAKRIAEEIRPQEITGGTTAYTGAPTVNTRGEVIQGNNRSDALRYMWENNLPAQQQAYKHYLIDNAERFGLDREAVSAMQRPVLVNMLDVDDAEAIRLGQMTAQDTESGGIERIKPKNVTQKLGEDMQIFASRLLQSGDEESSFGQLVDRNGADVLQWMNQTGAISNTQFQSAFDSKGNLTPEAKNDLQKVLYQAVFKGGSQQLEEMFDALPAKAQRSLLATAFRDMDSPLTGQMLPELQASIAAYHQLMTDPTFAAAKKIDDALRAVDGFIRAVALDDRLEQYIPADNFSNFALHLAAMYKAADISQSTLAGYFNQMYDLAQGKKAATLFEEADTTEYPLAEVIKRVLNIEYQPAKNGNNNDTNGGADVALRNQERQRGELRGDESPSIGESDQAGAEPTERGRGTADDSQRGTIEPTGYGDFGPIFTQFKGDAKGAISKLIELKAGEAVGALHHRDVGDIDLVWGIEGTGHSDGMGLAKLVKYHPEVVEHLQDILDDMVVVKRTENRINLESKTHKAAVRLTWNNEAKKWLLTAFEKRETPKSIDKTTDTGDNPTDMRGDTALSQNSGVSDSKDSYSASEKQAGDANGSLAERVKAAEQEVNTNPTEAQKRAGNYKKGHVQVGTFDVTIEQPVGSVRRGTDADGKEWETTMQNTYGYIRGTEGVDGDHIDVFLSTDIDGWNGRRVVIVDQYNPDNTFDEHKVMLGFNDKANAINAYLANYEKGWENGRRLVFSTATLEDFEKWIESSHRKQKPYHEYKIADKADVTVSEPSGDGYADALVSEADLSKLDDRMRENLLDYLGRMPSVEVAVISDEGDIKSQADLSADAKDEMIKALQSGDVLASYCHENKKIYIFANILSKAEESHMGLESVLVHENAHAVADRLERVDDAFLRRFSEAVGRMPYRFYRNLGAGLLECGYTEEDLDGEIFAVTFQRLHQNPRPLSSLRDRLDADDKKVFDNILKELYGEKEFNKNMGGNDLRRAGTLRRAGESGEEERASSVRAAGDVHLPDGSTDGGRRGASVASAGRQAGGVGSSEGAENVNRQGDGYGAYTDAEISYLNDPVSKVMGKNRFSKKRQAEFAARERQRMATRIKELAERMHLDNVEIITDASQLDGKRAKAKGYYNKRTGKITIVIPNNFSTIDAEQTLLHESVAHYGLRQLFGEQFNTFLDNVYQSADESVRRKIAELAAKNGWDFRTATEEYLAGLAEDMNFEDARVHIGWWSRIKQLFLDMLESIGFEGFRDRVGVVLTDNELRYILWRSYENLAEPGRSRSILGEAKDVAKQAELKVGNYAENNIEAEYAAEGELYRSGDFTPRDRVLVRHIYEDMVSKGSYQFQEAVQDSMLGLKKLYQSILGKKTRIEDVAGYENAYLFENRMSSMNAGEQHEYFQRYMQPLLKEIGRIAGASIRRRREFTDYIMAKHGLERNEYMRNEAASNGEETDRDFAGLIGLTGEADWRSAEATAQQWVDDYENMVDTTALWQAVNNATKATLEKVYQSGIISKETYEKILGMYQYYIPLRGWDQTTSEDVYGYLTSKSGPLGGSIMKKAAGRESMADDPIATIAMMADDAIRQGNRNLMKQRFLNFVLNHPSNAVSLNDLWLEYDDVADEWRPVFADIDGTDSADEVAQKVEAFEQRMESLRSSQPDKYKKGREAQHIPYMVVKNNLREHQILIKRNGRTFVATINGNPRAAQAINDLTNPDVDTNGVVGNMLKAGTWVNRQLSAFYTTRNPDFVVGNFFRDMLYSNCMTWVKESPRYARRFHTNFGRVNPIVMRRLLGKWENGSLDMSNNLEKMFYQFMINGGETGYTNVRDIEGHKRAVAAELKKQGSTGRKVWTALGMQLDLLNRSAENCARFAAFVTSRDFGRSIDRAIYDAKEISVNFNKKGSGGKMVNANGQTVLGKTGAYLSGGGRLLYVFWNAGVQGMTNFGRAAKCNPAKFSTGAATLFTLGYVIPMLAQMLGGGDGDDDDKNAYYNLPEYIRRSNICFKAGDQWVTIPLPIEYRAMYGMGELAHGIISGNERYSNSELAQQMTAQVSQMLPIDVMEGGGGISPFIPSAFKPVTEAYIVNKSWTGLPIYKDTPFNKNDPEWTKAYASTDTHLVDFAKWLNETSGGDDFKKGLIDINPAKIEYLLNGTFGGVFTFPNKLKKAAETSFGDRDFEWRNMPIANRLIKSGDERTANRKLRNEYFKSLKEYEATGQLMRKYQNAEDDGIMGYAERINFLENSPEYARWEIFDEFKADIDAYREDISSETDKEERSKLEAEMYAVMRELVNALHDPEAYRNSEQE